MRAVARELGVTLRTVQRWCSRARGQRLDRCDLSDRTPGPRSAVNRTPSSVERSVTDLRRQLRDGDLGECGALEIHRQLGRLGPGLAPSVRTIGRILQRHDLVGIGRRRRWPPPPRAWYLPAAAAQQAEIDCFDGIEGLVIYGGYHFEVLTAMSVHGHLAAAWPVHPCITSNFVAACLVQHWRAFGLPAHAQFDNDTIFAGNRRPGAIGRVIRLCLSLGVTPVFAPPRETGFQAAIERFNGLWQDKAWARFRHANFLNLCETSQRFIDAHRDRHAIALDAMLRRPWPADWIDQTSDNLRGQIIFIRRLDAAGRASVLERTFTVAKDWPHRLVRAEWSLDARQIAFYQLRRRHPDHQPLLKLITCDHSLLCPGID